MRRDDFPMCRLCLLGEATYSRPLGWRGCQLGATTTCAKLALPDSTSALPRDLPRHSYFSFVLGNINLGLKAPKGTLTL